jgi:cytochrome c553
MKRNLSLLLISASLLFAACNERAEVKGATAPAEASATNKFGGYESLQKWGEHIVTIAACHDCHTPPKMTPNGPEMDSTRLLSGHPSDWPDPQINRAEMESKGLTVTQSLTAWAGPWGISYAANLTSDSTGTGLWTEQQFFTAIRHGKFKGLPNSRTLLPPMPWTVYKNMTDDELRAIFAYLKSTKPIKNKVPAPKPPVAAGRGEGRS